MTAALEQLERHVSEDEKGKQLGDRNESLTKFCDRQSETGVDRMGITYWVCKENCWRKEWICRWPAHQEISGSGVQYGTQYEKENVGKACAERVLERAIYVHAWKIIISATYF